jgi:hypothetical protein
MQLSDNQLALAAWYRVYGEDREISPEEARALWEVLYEDPYFYRGSGDDRLSMAYIADDYHRTMELFVHGKMVWNELFAQLKSLPLSRKCEIVDMIYRTTVLLRQVVDLSEEWTELTHLMKKMDVTFEDYDAWSKAHT